MGRLQKQRLMELQFPKSKLFVVLFVCFNLGLWITNVFAVSEYLQASYDAGYYSPDGDAILMPMVGCIGLSVVGFPLVLIVLFFALLDFPYDKPVIFWCRELAGQSFFWTTLFVLIIAWCFYDIVTTAELNLIITPVRNLGQIVSCIIFQAIFMTRLKEKWNAWQPKRI